MVLDFVYDAKPKLILTSRGVAYCLSDFNYYLMPELTKLDSLSFCLTKYHAKLTIYYLFMPFFLK